MCIRDRLPTVDKRLRDQALFEEEDIFYLQSPLFEKPLQVLPEETRKAFASEIISGTDQEILREWLANHSHYDKEFSITSSGRLSPSSEYVLRDFMRTREISFSELLPYLKVKRMVYDLSLIHI